MKLGIAAFLLCVVVSSAYFTGTFTSPKHLPILTQSDLIRAIHKPAVLEYPFKITNESGTFVNLNGLEPMARLAEKRKYEMSMRVKVTPHKNLSMALEKCGLRSMPVETVFYNQVIIFPPQYITILSDVGFDRCEKFDFSMNLVIKGPINLTGMISFNLLEFPSNAGTLLKNIFVHYLYPIVYAIAFLLACCLLLPIFWCFRYRVIGKCANHRNWRGYSKLHALYGKKQTNNVAML